MSDDRDSLSEIAAVGRLLWHRLPKILSVIASACGLLWGAYEWGASQVEKSRADLDRRITEARDRYSVASTEGDKARQELKDSLGVIAVDNRLNVLEHLFVQSEGQRVYWKVFAKVKRGDAEGAASSALRDYNTLTERWPCDPKAKDSTGKGCTNPIEAGKIAAGEAP